MGNESGRYVFGPVPSRRLGRSLGVDLVPFKTCSLDCIYCQLGRTTHKTTKRGEYAPTEEVIDQLRFALSRGDRPDSVTMSGSGEPTLHSRLDEIIAVVKQLSDVPVTVLTNGTLFHLPEVRQACAQADRVVPSLDAATESSFQQINRPAEGLTLAQHVEGLVAFRDEFKGQLWLETMIVAGINDSDEEVQQLQSLVARIRPDQIQLNTVVRPPAEDAVQAASSDRLARIAELLGPTAEVIVDRRAKHMPSDMVRLREDVLATLERRPCTLDDVVEGMGIHHNEAIKHLTDLLSDGLIERVRRGDREYYQFIHHDSADPDQVG